MSEHVDTCYHADCDEDDFAVHNCNSGVCPECGANLEQARANIIEPKEEEHDRSE